MNRADTPLQSSPVVRGLFAAGLLTIPFDAVRGVPALGELGNELSFPFFAGAIALALLLSLGKRSAALSSSLALRVAGAAVAIVLVSYLVNALAIHGIVFRERTGFNKFVTSVLVLLYGFSIAWLAEQAREEDWRPLVGRFICWSALIAIVYALIEIPGRAGHLGGLFQSIDSIIHSRQADILNAWDGSINEKVLYGWDDRLRSVSFEPPAFGNYTGFAWPWVWYMAATAPSERRLRYGSLLVAFTLIILVSGSRTGMLMLAINVAGIAILAWVYTRPEKGSEALAAARLLLPALLVVGLVVAGAHFAAGYSDVVEQLMIGDSVSNVSRLAFQLAAVDIFLSHPLLGVGLGQFAFHAAGALPDWAFRSPEVAPMITYPAAPWPTVYSIYARLAAELGIAGLAGWIALWCGVAMMLIARAREARSRNGRTITPHYPVILNCVGVLASGVATDTFRTPMIWVTLGLGCALLGIRKRVSVATRSSAPAPA